MKMNKTMLAVLVNLQQNPVLDIGTHNSKTCDRLNWINLKINNNHLMMFQFISPPPQGADRGEEGLPRESSQGVVARGQRRDLPGSSANDSLWGRVPPQWANHGRETPHRGGLPGRSALSPNLYVYVSGRGEPTCQKVRKFV